MALMTKDPKIFIEKFHELDQMGTLIGHKVIELNEAECLSEYQSVKAHYNPGNILHGGALFAAMDSAQGALIHFSLDRKFQYAVTGTATIKYFAPVKDEKIKIRTWFESKQDRKHFLHSLATTESGVEVAKLEEVWIAVPNSNY
jgi:acyl-coenzyme A thioesterase PaaI-like protein